MSEIPNPAGDLGKASMETALAFARITMESAERLARLQLDAARSLVEENAAQAESLAGVTDPAQLAEARAKAAEAVMQKAIGYSKDVYDLAANAQQAFARVMESGISRFNEDMLKSMEKTFGAAPGAEAGMAAMRGAMAAASAAMTNMGQAAQQMAEMAGKAATPPAGGPAAKGGARKR